MDVAAYLTGILRDNDRPRYLSTLYAPANKRTSLMALYAFNAEIAAIRDRVREPMAGEVRLQWWRDVLADDTPAFTGNPVADALQSAIKEYQLPRAAFARMLDARVFDLYDDPMPDCATLEGYCGETASTLIQLAAMIVDANVAPDWAAAAGHAGCAQAMTGILQLLPIHRARGQCFVPVEVLDVAGLSVGDLVSGENRGGCANAILALAALARKHLTSFETQARKLPVSLRSAFLPLVSEHTVLKRIEARPNAVLDQPCNISALRIHLQMLMIAARGWH